MYFREKDTAAAFVVCVCYVNACVFITVRRYSDYVCLEIRYFSFGFSAPFSSAEKCAGNIALAEYNIVITLKEGQDVVVVALRRRWLWLVMVCGGVNSVFNHWNESTKLLMLMCIRCVYFFVSNWLLAPLMIILGARGGGRDKGGRLIAIY